MIQPEKLDRALEALHRALTHARLQAYLAKQDRLATLLDHLEILPSYIADPRFDRTSDFRQSIVDIASVMGDCSYIIDAFDEDVSISHHWY